VRWGREGVIDFEKEVAVRLKILTDFIKGKVSLDPMENIFTIPKELKYLEGVVKLVQRCKNEKHMVAIIAIMAPNLPIVCMISINKNHKSKTLHVLVKTNNHIVEGLVDIGASMTILVVNVVRELGTMHLVVGLESYKIASSVLHRPLA
jgi:hypothetical protein